MQQFTRPPLSAAQLAYLKKKTGALSATSDVTSAWESARRTKIMKSIHATLETMSGPRARCMYCLDSHGTDVDHFFPKSTYPERAFLWINMLLCCSGCNTAKLAKFPLAPTGQPLIINPTVDDPWLYLEYNSATDLFAARWTDGIENKRGAQTLESFRVKLHHECVVEGRRRTRRNLERAVSQFLACSESKDLAELTLIETLRDNDAYGLLHWFFSYEGADLHPFARLRDGYPDVWKRSRAAIFALA